MRYGNLSELEFYFKERMGKKIGFFLMFYCCLKVSSTLITSDCEGRTYSIQRQHVLSQLPRLIFIPVNLLPTDRVEGR